MPAVLVRGHGPFTWGKTPEEAEKNSLALENIAEIAFGTLQLNLKSEILPDYILRKHYERKHGPNAYYGQKK
jgi:L-ribulose-5-phosphate 4-epimerase